MCVRVSHSNACVLVEISVATVALLDIVFFVIFPVSLLILPMPWLTSVTYIRQAPYTNARKFSSAEGPGRQY